MKMKILIAASLVALIVPAASLGSGPTGQDRENGARACKALRALLTPDIFRQTYGTVQSNRRNAMGRCVSQWTHAAHQARISARSACSAEQADPNFAAGHGGMTFDEFYGTNRNDRNAFGKCVSGKAQASQEQQQANLENAARQCRTERGDTDFAANHGGKSFSEYYGTNRNKKNAFGKCVSQKEKVMNQAPAPTI